MNWINSGCDYKAGVSIYSKLGGNKTLLGLFNKFSTRYYQDKLYSELIKIKVDFEKSEIITPVEIKTQNIEFESMPSQLQKLDREKSKLFTNILKARTELKSLVKLQTKGRITIADACAVMAEMDRFKRLKPFSVTFVSYNKRTGKGGDIVRYPNCYLRVVNNTGSRIIKDFKKNATHQPNHWQNSTRNFEVIGTNQIKKLHIWLMLEFNGMEVVTSDQG
jgi:signal peptidase I